MQYARFFIQEINCIGISDDVTSIPSVLILMGLIFFMVHVKVGFIDIQKKIGSFNLQ